MMKKLFSSTRGSSVESSQKDGEDAVIVNKRLICVESSQKAGEDGVLNNIRLIC